MTDQQAFRQQALERLMGALGEPEVIKVSGGEMYRWVLKRPHNLHMYLTLDSPELPDIAHLIVSDPRSRAADPVVSLTMRTLPEVDAVVKKVIEQWKQGMGTDEPT